MTDFRQRLEKAIERGQRVRDARVQAEAERALTEQELKTLHSRYRLELVDRIERALKQLADRFPGFRYDTIVGHEGWGAAISRDDVRLDRAGDVTYYSRVEMVIRPFSSYHVLELTAKATIYNKELFNRSQFQRLTDVDTTTFEEMIDNWALEFAERYAAKN